MQHDTGQRIYRARLRADEALARRMSDFLAEMLDPARAVSAAAEDRSGRWHLEVHFVPPLDAKAIRTLIGAEFGTKHARAMQCAPVAERDWTAASLAALAPVRAGRFVVHGAHDRGRLRGNDISVEIEAGFAFGTGHHGTTRGCLLALDRLAKARKSRPLKRTDLPLKAGGNSTRILDLGTGTGVLAIAAAKILRSRVLATDNDARAARVARANARANRIAALVETMHALGFNARRLAASRHFDLVLANILLAPLQRLAAPMARRVKPGGHVVLSGLLPGHANAAVAAYRAQPLALVHRVTLDGWVTLVLRRRPPSGAGAPSMHRR